MLASIFVPNSCINFSCLIWVNLRLSYLIFDFICLNCSLKLFYPQWRTRKVQTFSWLSCLSSAQLVWCWRDILSDTLAFCLLRMAQVCSCLFFFLIFVTFIPFLVPVNINIENRILDTMNVASESKVESINLMTAPSIKPSRAPSAKPSVAPSMDYSCVHADAWLLNSAGVYSSNYDATVDITSSGFVNDTVSSTGWKATFNGIPYYDHTFTTSEITTLNSRPKASSDFTTGQTTAVAGRFYNFGDNIGYTTSKCVDGYWPPGPGCPKAYTGTATFPVYPSPEYRSGMSNLYYSKRFVMRCSRWLLSVLSHWLLRERSPLLVLE